MARQLAALRRHPGALGGVALFTVVAVVLTAMVAGTLSRGRSGDTITLTAVFSDATGLRAGDDVRLAGVRVGTVTDARLGTGAQTGRAVVTFTVAADTRLRTDTIASIDYLNLMGQRYIALGRPAGATDLQQAAYRGTSGTDRGEGSARVARGTLEDGDTIPLRSTRPALDLTAMMNAFRPIFDLLEPEDVNTMASNIVALLQGQGGTLQHLLDQTTELTTGLTRRDAAFGEVVDNLSLVLDDTASHRAEISRMLRGLGSLAEGVAADRDRIATGLRAMARLSATTADVIDEAGPSVIDDAKVARIVTEYLATHQDELLAAGEGLPVQLEVYLRSLGYGSYLNVYICNLDIRLKGVAGSLPLSSNDTYTERCR
ncbi:MCE family protein [Nocardioides sp. GY 10113]|uniref:MCE family protein n=1 Tax=Nocardioides sp. GY 10113 TaxID=2569761 RepID=UPI0010A76A88|nr:MlaD family protein [Nocardioides sp. GY 10113]TIC87928.1 MCE family protein [Nocardioides sp. GY 10113]